MKIILICILFVSVTANEHLLRSVNHPETIEEINKKTTTWIAGENERFNNMTLAHAQRLLGSFLTPPTRSPPEKNVEIVENLPTDFDLRLQWPQCESIREIRDQSNCGSCWAFGAAEAMSDRICIASKGKLQTRVSAEHILSCCKICGNGCKGGTSYQAWNFWVNYGIPTGGNFEDKSTCQPYSFPPCDHIKGKSGSCINEGEYKTPNCRQTCDEGFPASFEEDKSYGESAYTILPDERFIMSEIYMHGSVEATMITHEDFYNYKSGIYESVHGRVIGGHAVKIIGWGNEEGVKYWLVVNSWNDRWGDKGTFKILRGVNHCGIEGNIVAGIPKLIKDEKFLE